MKSKTLVPLLLLAGLSEVCNVPAHASPAEPSASGPGVIDDARCVVVGISMGSVRGATPQTAGLMIALYYLGRLDARSPKPGVPADDCGCCRRTPQLGGAAFLRHLHSARL
jgi:hypothetical protein